MLPRRFCRPPSPGGDTWCFRFDFVFLIFFSSPQASFTSQGRQLVSSATAAKSTRDGRVVEILVHFTAKLLVFIGLWLLRLEKGQVFSHTFNKRAMEKTQKPCGSVLVESLFKKAKQGLTAVYHERAIQIIRVYVYIAISAKIYVY